MASRDDGLSRAAPSLVAIVIGAVAWIALVAVPARDDTNLSGGSFFLAIFFSAVVLGVLVSNRHHMRVAALLVTPALVLAGWTAPRGDNDGLWTLWFLFLVFSIIPTAACHWIGNALRRKTKASASS